MKSKLQAKIWDMPPRGKRSGRETIEDGRIKNSCKNSHDDSNVNILDEFVSDHEKIFQDNFLCLFQVIQISILIYEDKKLM